MVSARLTVFLATVGVLLAGLAVLLLASAGPGYRLGWWELGTAFSLFRWAAWGGIAGGALGVLSLLVGLRFPARRALWRGALAVMLGVVALGVPWYQLSKARSVPPIHDISTDLENPPAFDAILPLRADAPNPAAYGGPEVAEQQREAYPDIETLTFDRAPAVVFDAAQAAARDMGWEIVAADPTEGHIEAVATTPWFGFKDDVVVRIEAENGRTAVDVRSVSRVGRSDLGANAARIRAFADKLRHRVEEQEMQ